MGRILAMEGRLHKLLKNSAAKEFLAQNYGLYYGQKRVLEKILQIKCVLSLQKRLYEKHVIVPLLVIPSLTFHKVSCLAIRIFWEVLIVNSFGDIMHKIPRLVT